MIPREAHPYSNLSSLSSAYFDFHKRYLLYIDIHIFTTFPVEIDTIKKTGQNKSFFKQHPTLLQDPQVRDLKWSEKLHFKSHLQKIKNHNSP